MRDGLWTPWCEFLEGGEWSSFLLGWSSAGPKGERFRSCSEELKRLLVESGRLCWCRDRRAPPVAIRSSPVADGATFPMISRSWQPRAGSWCRWESWPQPAVAPRDDATRSLQNPAKRPPVLRERIPVWTRCLPPRLSSIRDGLRGICAAQDVVRQLVLQEWPLTTWGSCWCKDHTSNDPFSRCKSVQQFGYRWNWRSQNTVWLPVHNWTTKSRRKELYTWYCVCVVKPSDKTHDTNDNVHASMTITTKRKNWNL